jgi:hypothetical protein
MRFPHLAHRSAAAHKLHSTPQQDGMNLISGNDQTSSRLPAFSLLLPESCPNNRDRRRERFGSGYWDGRGAAEAAAFANNGWIGIEMVKTLSRPLSQQQLRRNVEAI